MESSFVDSMPYRDAARGFKDEQFGMLETVSKNKVSRT
jgi:hypothetical protein